MHKRRVPLGISARVMGAARGDVDSPISPLASRSLTCLTSLRRLRMIEDMAVVHKVSCRTIRFEGTR